MLKEVGYKMVKPINDLTAAYARSRLKYDPLTGRLIWLSYKDSLGRRNNRDVGKTAGTLVNGYLTIRLPNKKGKSRAYKAHRVAYLIHYGVWPPHELDHKDKKKSNNKFKNLRKAKPHQNSCNNPARKNLSGLKGAYRDGKRWKSQIGVKRKTIFLGMFDTASEAHAAYKKAVKRYHGQFGSAA